MPPTAVFFDMDGVLLDSFEAWLAVLNAAAVNFACPPVTREAYRSAFGQATAFEAELFFPGRTAAEVDAFYVDHFHEHAASAIAMPGASSLLETLVARDVPTAVITNTHSAIARPLLEALNLIPHALVAVDDVANPKPAPDMVLRACEVLDMPPWEVLVVGDSLLDQQAAAAAGTFFAGYGGIGGNFPIDDLNQVLSILDGTYL
jgi:HAD superfamily hydrolase (TIGR01509 family)